MILVLGPEHIHHDISLPRAPLEHLLDAIPVLRFHLVRELVRPFAEIMVVFAYILVWLAETRGVDKRISAAAAASRH